MKKLSRFLLAVALVAFMSAPAFAQTGAIALSKVTQTGVSQSFATGAASAVEVQVWSASTSTATVLIQQSIDGSTWYTAVSLSNPTSGGSLYIGPPAPYTRVNLSARSAGTISATVANLQNAQNVTGWKSIETLPAQTASTNLTTTDDTTTNATYYPIFQTNLGTYPAKTSSSILTYNPSTGSFGATAFAGTTFTGTRFLSSGTAPTVAGTTSNACGTSGAPSIAGKDQAFVITVGGTSATSCRVTFNVAFANAPVCTANAQTTTTPLNVVSTTAQVDISSTALTPGEKIYGACHGY